MTGWFFAIALPVVATFAAIRKTLPRGAAADLLAVGLAAGCGIGASGTLLVVWRFIMPAHWMPVFPAIDAVVWLLVLAMALWRGRRGWHDDQVAPPETSRWKRSHVLLLTAVVAAAVLSVRDFAQHTARLPHGEWDAWAVWNLKARFLFRGGEDWIGLFSPELPHAAYPLMLPGTVARLWLWIGADAPVAAAVVAAVFLYAIPVVVAGSVAQLRGWRPALWAALIVLSAAPLTLVATYQIADVPLSFFTVATIALLAASLVDRARWQTAACAGVMLGLAGLTKDEGLPFLIGMTVSYACYPVVRRQWKARYRHVTAMVAATLPAWGLILATRSSTASTGLAQAFLAPDVGNKVWNADRHLQVIQTFAETLWFWAGDGWAGVGLLFGAALVFGGYRLERQTYAVAGFGAAAVGLMLASYYAAFIVTPYDLTWHLTSLSRVLVQIWPAFVWTFCLGATLERTR